MNEERRKKKGATTTKKEERRQTHEKRTVHKGNDIGVEGGGSKEERGRKR